MKVGALIEQLELHDKNADVFIQGGFVSDFETWPIQELKIVKDGEYVGVHITAVDIIG